MSDDSHKWPMTHAERRHLIDDPTISREARILMEADGQDDNETITLYGDDTAVSSVVVPRVWQLPPQPARGISVRDRYGTVWQRPGADPDFVGLWHAPGMKVLRWSSVLERGPLTEVM